MLRHQRARPVFKGFSNNFCHSFRQLVCLPSFFTSIPACDILHMYDQLPGLVGPNGVQPLTSAAGSRGSAPLHVLSSALRAPLDVTLELTCAVGILFASASALTGVVHGFMFLVMFAAYHLAQAAFGTFTSFQVPTLLRATGLHPIHHFFSSLQWDILLLEVGAVCIVAAPWTSLRLHPFRHSRPLPLYS